MTTFSMNFDFTSAGQRKVLQDLQEDHYQFLGFKGAKGPGQVSAGLPTWFAVPYGNMFGQVTVDYTPKYKVYVFNQAKIAAFTTIQMQVLSQEVELGSSLVFNADGTFATGKIDVPSDSIALIDNRPAGTPNVTVGLAGLVNLPAGPQYLPFCAFTLTPQGSLNMTPLETICLMAAQVDLQSGSVQAVASAPGCSFSFSDQHISYDLEIKDSIYQITNVPGTTPVTPVTSGETLALVINR